MKWSCSLCGSTDWPSTTTHCPLCRAEEPENKPFGLEEEIDEEEETNQDLATTKTKPPIANEQTTVLPK